MNTSHAGSLDIPALERGAKRIWAEVLGMCEGEEDATFFGLQGQSISAVRILARIEGEFGVALDVSFLFDDPDLETFVRHVVASAAPGRVARERDGKASGF